MMNFLNLLGIKNEDVERIKNELQKKAWEIEHIHKLLDELAVDIKYIRTSIDTMDDILDNILYKLNDIEARLKGGEGE